MTAERVVLRVFSACTLRFVEIHWSRVSGIGHDVSEEAAERREASQICGRPHFDS